MVTIGAPAIAPSLVACGPARQVLQLPTVAEARRQIVGLRQGWKSTGAWSVAVVLHHAAQSIEYSLQGFPELKGTWFRATVGAAAFAVFDARGAMRHGLDEPIPGAPAIAPDVPLPAAIERLDAAFAAFEKHSGALAPHFAYGALDKAQYTRAHLMHLANHWQLFQRA